MKLATLKYIVASTGICLCASSCMLKIAPTNNIAMHNTDTNILQCQQKAAQAQLTPVGKTIQTPRYTMITLAHQGDSSINIPTDGTLTSGQLCIIDKTNNTIEITAINQLIYQNPQQ